MTSLRASASEGLRILSAPERKERERRRRRRRRRRRGRWEAMPAVRFRRRRVWLLREVGGFGVGERALYKMLLRRRERWRKGAEKTKRFLRQEGEKSLVRVETELPLMGPDGLKPD
ncbi:hypothetical protein AAC387_Pa12g0996 [Persea americana]